VTAFSRVSPQTGGHIGKDNNQILRIFADPIGNNPGIS